MSAHYFSKLINSPLWKKPRPFWLALVVVVGLAFIVLIMVSKEPKLVPSEVVLPGVLPLASGKQTYDIVTDNSQGLQIIEVDVDPLDVKQGEVQIVTVQVKDEENNPITQENQVEAIVYTDNTSVPFSFSLKNVADSATATSAVWQGSWVCEDTYNFKYMLFVKAKSATEEHSIDLSFR
jgi:hypothetical protein